MWTGSPSSISKMLSNETKYCRVKINISQSEVGSSSYNRRHIEENVKKSTSGLPSTPRSRSLTGVSVLQNDVFTAKAMNPQLVNVSFQEHCPNGLRKAADDPIWIRFKIVDCGSSIHASNSGAIKDYGTIVVGRWFVGT